MRFPILDDDHYYFDGGDDDDGDNDYGDNDDPDDDDDDDDYDDDDVDDNDDGDAFLVLADFHLFFNRIASRLQDHFRYCDGYDDDFLLVLASSHFSVNRFAIGINIPILILGGYRCHSDDGGDVDDGDDDDFCSCLSGCPLVSESVCPRAVDPNFR